MLRDIFLIARPPLIVLNVKVLIIKLHSGRRAGGKCGKAERFGEAFPSSCWKPHQKKAAQGPPICSRISIAAAFFTGLFLFLFFFLFLMSFPCGKPAGSRYESATPLCQRLKETFERDQHGELDICSDVVLRGLGYKDYGHSLPASF